MFLVLFRSINILYTKSNSLDIFPRYLALLRSPYRHTSKNTITTRKDKLTERINLATKLTINLSLQVVERPHLLKVQPIVKCKDIPHPCPENRFDPRPRIYFSQPSPVTILSNPLKSRRSMPPVFLSISDLKISFRSLGVCLVVE